MKKLTLLLVVLSACRSAGPESPIDQLRSDDPVRVKASMEALTARGDAAIPELKAALTDNDLRLRRRAKEVIARITGQWGDGSGLKWRRTFDDAKAEAAKTGAPILLLNLFGKFDEEFC